MPIPELLETLILDAMKDGFKIQVEREDGTNIGPVTLVKMSHPDQRLRIEFSSCPYPDSADQEVVEAAFQNQRLTVITGLPPFLR